MADSKYGALYSKWAQPQTERLRRADSIYLTGEYRVILFKSSHVPLLLQKCVRIHRKPQDRVCTDVWMNIQGLITFYSYFANWGISFFFQTHILKHQSLLSQQCSWLTSMLIKHFSEKVYRYIQNTNHYNMGVVQSYRALFTTAPGHNKIHTCSTYAKCLFRPKRRFIFVTVWFKFFKGT